MSERSELHAALGTLSEQEASVDGRLSVDVQMVTSVYGSCVIFSWTVAPSGQREAALAQLARVLPDSKVASDKRSSVVPTWRVRKDWNSGGIALLNLTLVPGVDDVDGAVCINIIR